MAGGQNRRRRRAAARRQLRAALLLAHPVLGSHLRPWIYTANILTAFIFEQQVIDL